MVPGKIPAFPGSEFGNQLQSLWLDGVGVVWNDRICVCGRSFTDQASAVAVGRRHRGSRTILSPAVGQPDVIGQHLKIFSNVPLVAVDAADERSFRGGPKCPQPSALEPPHSFAMPCLKKSIALLLRQELLHLADSPHEARQFASQRATLDRLPRRVFRHDQAHG